MALRGNFQVKLDKYATVPDEQELLKYMKVPVNRAARVSRTMVENIVSQFKSKRARNVSFVSTEAKITQAKGNFKGRAIVAAMGTNKEKTPIVWLEGGTAWRARRMSPTWVSKTSVGSLRVGIGRGYAMRGKNAWGRFPGIKARNFRDSIVERLEPPFFRECEEKFSAMFKDLGW